MLFFDFKTIIFITRDRPFWKKCLEFLQLILFLVILILHIVLISFIAMSGTLKKQIQSLAHQWDIPYPLAISHRGASHYAPESTLASYQYALNWGVDYLELDVQRTKDNVLVVFHDMNLERKSNVSEIFPDRAQKGISAFTWDELQQLDIGSWFNKEYPQRARSSYKGLKIIRLEDVVILSQSAEHKPGLYLETKLSMNYPGIELQIIEVLKKYDFISDSSHISENHPSQVEANPHLINVQHGKSRVILQSFQTLSLNEFKKHIPHVPRVYLISPRSLPGTNWNELIKLGAEHHGIGIRYSQAYPWRIRKMHKHGLFVHLYTIDNVYLFHLFHFLGADGFFSNRIDLLLKFYGRDKDVPKDLYKKL